MNIDDARVSSGVRFHELTRILQLAGSLVKSNCLVSNSCQKSTKESARIADSAPI